MFMRRALLAVGVIGCCVVGGQAVAASSNRSTIARLKQPKAGIANVHGLRFVYGPAVTAMPPGPYGVVTPTLASVACPAGMHARGGGWNSADTSPDPVTISSNEATRGLRGWLVVAEDTSTDSAATGYTFQATAVCG